MSKWYGQLSFGLLLVGSGAESESTVSLWTCLIVDRCALGSRWPLFGGPITIVDTSDAGMPADEIVDAWPIPERRPHQSCH